MEKKLKHKSLRNQLIISMLAFGLFITLIFAALESYFIYQKELGSLEKQFDQIEISFIQGLSNSLWIIDTKLAQIQVAGILELPNIQYVEIVSDNTSFVTSGTKPDKEDSLIREYVLNYKNLDEPLNIGKLIVVANLSDLNTNAINNFSNIIFYEGISIFIIVLLMSFLVNNMILRHLDKMSHFMQETSWKNINQIFNFDRKTNSNYKDELDILANSFNTQRVELHLAESSIRFSEEKFSKAFQSSPQIFIITHVDDGKIIEVNTAFEHKSGWTREETIGKTSFELGLWSNEERAKVMYEIQDKGSIKNKDVIFTKKNGDTGNGEMSAEIITISGELCMLGIINDVTKRKITEQKLRDSEERLSKVFESSPDAIIVSKINDGIIIDVNKNFEVLFILQKNDAIGKTAEELNIWAHKDDRSKVIEVLKEKGNVKYLESKYRKTTGELADCYISCEVVEINREACVITSIRDITEQIKMQIALRQSEEKFSKAFLSSPHPIGISTLDNAIILEINDAFEEVFGYSRNEIIGTSSFELGLWDKPELRATFIEKVKHKGGVREFEAVAKIKSGELIHCHLSAELVDIENEKCIVIMIQDITELKRAEEKILISQERLRNLANRLEEVREQERIGIAREVHDELGQALTGLKIDLTWLADKTSKSTAMTNRINTMIKNIDTTVDVVRKISSELRPPVLDDLGLEAAIEWVTEGFSQRTKIKHKLHLDCDELDMDMTRDTAVFRIYQETLTNIARHSGANSFEADIRIVNNELKLWVKDNGIGITEDQIQDNKSIGLIGMQERAAHISATVSLKNADSGGTEVTLTVPLSPETKY